MKINSATIPFDSISLDLVSSVTEIDRTRRKAKIRIGAVHSALFLLPYS